MTSYDSFQSLVEGFFLEWLDKGRKVSPNTVASYRDAFSLYLRWLCETQKTTPADITMNDFTSDNIMAFLLYLSDARMCSPKTVNCRLAAFKSFCKYASFKAPQWLSRFQKIEKIPEKRVQIKEVDYLAPEEIGWLLESCVTGSESELLLALLYNTGARISELVTATGRDVTVSEAGRCRLKVTGKGRKDRTIPLWSDTTMLLRAHMKKNLIGVNDYLFIGRNVDHLTRSGARSRIDVVVKAATLLHPQLKSKKITPHTFRHSTAMSMLSAGIDIATVAIWLGHEHINTTHKYVVSDMSQKEEALAKVRRDWEVKPRKAYIPNDDVLDFLMSL
jgi:site-specific recombinase XerD